MGFQPIFWLTAAIGVVALLYSGLRSWRTVVVAGRAVVGSGLAQTLLPRGAAELTQVGLFSLLSTLVLIRNEPLWRIRVADREMATGYQTAVRQIAKIGREPSPAGGSRLPALEPLVAELVRLQGQAPSDDWRLLLGDAVAELNLRLDRLRSGIPVDASWSSDASQRWDAIEDRFQQLTKAKVSFWLLWPW